MAAQTHYPPPHGDEAELFRAYNPYLLRRVAHAVNHATPEIIEDACSYAWAQFMQCQPDRDRSWEGWLFRTAQRQACELERQARAHPVAGVRRR